MSEDQGDTYKGISGETVFFIHIKGLCKIQEEISKIQKNLDKAVQTRNKLQSKMEKADYETKVDKSVQEKEQKHMQDLNDTI